MARKRRVANIETPIRRPLYTDGDSVWVLWANYYYRGKVMKRGIDDYYYVHFWKYSKSWDRPLPVKRIIPTMPENDKWVKKHNDLIKAPINAKKKILRQIAKYKGKSAKETPPFITLKKLDASKYNIFSSKPAISTCNEVDHEEGNAHVNNDIMNSAGCATTVTLNGLENTKNTVNINTIDQESYVTADGGLSIKNASTSSSFSDESNDEKIILESIIMPDGSIQKIKRDSEDIDFPVNNDDPGITNYEQGLDELNQISNEAAPVPSFMQGLRLKPFANFQHAWPSSSDGNDCTDESLLPINDHNDTESNVEITIFGSEGHIATIDVRFDPRFNILSSIEGNQNLENLNESPMEVESKCDNFETNSSECLTVATATQSSDMVSDDIDMKTDLNTETHTLISSKLDTNDDNLPASSAVPDFVCNNLADLSNEAGSQSMQSNETHSLCDQVTTSTHAEQLNPNDQQHLTSLKENSIADNSSGLNNEAGLSLIDLNEATHNLCDQVTTSTHEEELNPNEQQHFISLNENSMADNLSDVLTDHGACLSSMNSNETHNACDYVTTSTQVEKLNPNDQQHSISLKDNTIASIDVINEAGSSSMHSNETYNLYDQVTTSTDEDQLNPNDEQNLTSLKEIADNSSDLAIDDASMSSMIVTESNDENSLINIAGGSTQGDLAIDEASTSMVVTESYEENGSMINVASGSTQGDLVIDDASMSSMIVAESNDESSCLRNVADGSTQGDLAIDDASMSSIMVTESNDESRLMNISSRSTQGDLVIDDASTSSIIVTESNDEGCLNIANGSTQGDKSSHCTNENWSSPCSSTSVRYYEDNDGHALDDDEQYVKTRKVSKKRVKLDDEDRKIYKKFSYDKQYSRAAKVKATEAISQMSKPPINKDKKSDVGKRPKNAGKKKDDDESSIVIMNLNHYNINTTNCLKQIFLEDKHLQQDMRLVTKLPATTSVLDILTEYATHFNAQESSGFKHILHIFNHLIGSKLLYPLEKQNHRKYVKNNPGVTNAQIYGLPHLCRFIFHLPMVFYAFKDSEEILPKLIQFIQRFPEYMEEKQMRLLPNIYDNTTPDYVRVSYYGVN